MSFPRILRLLPKNLRLFFNDYPAWLSPESHAFIKEGKIYKNSRSQNGKAFAPPGGNRRYKAGFRLLDAGRGGIRIYVPEGNR